MAGPTRTPIQREKDLEITASLYLRGWYQSAIAKKIGVTQKQISYDLHTLQKRWQQSALVDMDAVKGKELAKIDALERTYWQAWRKSQKEARETATLSKSAGEDNTYEAREKKTDRVGDPRYLQGVQWCIERRCKIVGIDAPAKFDVHDWRDEARRSGVEDVDGLFEQLVKAAMDRAGEGGSVGGSQAQDANDSTRD